MTSPLVSADAVRAAATRIRPYIGATPLRRAPTLGEDVWLKLESEQTTGSFKVRGALNVLASLSAGERRAGVVASSAGNHGLGLAWAARQFGIPATIFVPRTAPAVKRDGIAALGAKVDATAPNYDGAHEAALAHAARTGARYVDPCSGPDLLAGQGTVAMEIAEQLPGVWSVIIPVGGGGLLGGMASWFRATMPRVEIFGAQSERTAALAKSLAAGRVVPITDEPTLADGLAGGIEETALGIAEASLDAIALVTEDDIASAIALLHREEGLVVEGSGAVGVAALVTGALGEVPKPCVIVVSGRNIDPVRHSEVIAAARGS